MIYRVFFFFQAEDGIRDLVRSRGLGDVYKRQSLTLEKLLYLYRNHYPEISLREGVKELLAEIKRLSLIHI